MSKILGLSIDDLAKKTAKDFTASGGPSKQDLATALISVAKELQGRGNTDGVSEKLDKILKGQQSLSKDISDIKTEISDLKKREAANAELHEVTDRRLGALEAVTQATRDELEAAEQYLRRDQLKIYGLPVSYRSDEHGALLKDAKGVPIQEDTEVEVCALMGEIGVTLQAADISIAHRLPAAKGKVPPIIVKFTRRSKRREIFEAKRKLKENAARKGVFIADALTPQRSRLFRKLKDDDDVKAVWTTEGKINVLMKDKDKKIEIVKLCDIVKLGWDLEKIEGLGIYDNVRDD